MVSDQKTDNKVMGGEVYHPSEEVVAQARLQDWDGVAARALEDPQAFWAAEAEELEWFQKWDRVLDDSNKPFFKWFTAVKVFPPDPGIQLDVIALRRGMRGKSIG